MSHPNSGAGSSRGLRLLALAATSCIAIAGMAAPATAGASDPASQHRVGDHTLTASLNGAKESPNGDPNGTGKVTVRLRPAAGTVCATATWAHIGTPKAAHIHRGRPGVNGDVVVDLTGSVTGGTHCATGLRHTLIHRIAEHPRRFYFNIHNNAYPAGAIRGQLHR